MSDYSELMNHAAEFKRGGYKIEKPEEKRPVTFAPASDCKSAQAILANDNHARRVPAFVPPTAARPSAVMLDPDDVDDLYSIGEKDGKLWLKFTSVPKTLFVFAGVPAELIQGLRTSIDRDDYFAGHIKDKFPVEVVTAAKK